MNNKIKYGAIALAIVGISFTSCSDEHDLLGGEGKVYISAKVSSDVKVVSRSVDEDDLNSKLIVWISNDEGAVVRKYNGFDNIPADGISLLSDHYVIEGWTGDSASADWDKKYYKGREEIDITNGSNEKVELNCKIANSVVSVNYSDDVKEMLTDLKMTVGHKRGELVFEGDTQAKGYFMMPSTDKNLQWNLEGTLANGTTFTKSGVIENAQSATEYVLKVTYTQQSDEAIGGGYFSIEVVENAIEVEDVVTITMAPKFEGYNFDINEPIYAPVGNVTRKSVTSTVAGSFSSYVIKGDIIKKIFGDGDAIDIVKASSSVIAELKNGGIDFTQGYDNTGDVSWLKLNFEETLLNSLAEGNYTITLTATDSNNKTTTKVIELYISDAKVVANSVSDGDVWATHATISASIVQEGVEEVVLKYRASGASEWTTVTNATTSGSTVSANLTGLTPGTKYEFVAVGDNVTSSTVSFTTEAASQMPNSSFEEGCQVGDAYCFYPEGGSMFWDSGNHGSTTLGSSYNITERSQEKVADGTYSLKMKSRNIVIKFAAGNVFVGKYLATEGSDGVLGWGRPWTTRPAKLKGYLHYTSTPITATKLDNVSKGTADSGIIYIALVDGTTKTYNNESWPVIIKTKSTERSLFSKDDANVIAYGEKVITETTSGDSMVPFEITLDYTVTNVKPSNIIVTCSASRYGDYYTGGEGSTLYIDGLELVYE
jgi:hypothetical protein